MKKEKKKKNPGGRPPEYPRWLTPKGLGMIVKWGKEGLINEEIAARMGINVGTLYDWKKKFPKIDKALKEGKDRADMEVEQALYKASMGYWVTEEKTYAKTDETGKVSKYKETTKKWIPANSTSQIFWLKNRKPEDWRDRKETKLEGSLETKSEQTIEIDENSALALEEVYKKAFKELNEQHDGENKELDNG